MTPLRSLAGLLALSLALGSLPAAPVVAADTDPKRGLEAAAILKATSDAIVAAKGKRAGATWKQLDATTQKVIESQIERLKYLRRQLRREMESQLDRFRGPDDVCERNLIRQGKREADAQLERYLVQLRHVRGNRQKALTKAHRFIQKNVLKPLGKVAQKALKMSLPELAAMYLSGGAVGRTVLRTVFKRNVVRVVRRGGQDLAMRAAARKIWGPGALSAEDALRKYCEEKAKASPAPSDGAGSIGTHTVAADAACEGLTPKLPAPPFEERTIVVRVDWQGAESYRYHYAATRAVDPLTNPYSEGYAGGGSFAASGGGCTPQAEGCVRRDPLYLTEATLESVYVRDGAPVGHTNHAWVPGAYTLIAISGDVCTYPDGVDGLSHYERFFQDVEAAPAEVTLVATIEYYEKGEGHPRRTETRRATVPFYANQSTPPDGRRTFGEPIVLAPAGDPSPTSTPAVGGDGNAPWDE